jgi:8-oxo-dGTP pyrophosphatase MutT (NUDIX family)
MIAFDIVKIEDVKYVTEIIKKGLQFKYVYLLTDHVEMTFNLFKKQFQYFKTAGGIVSNAKGELLVMQRYDRWDLPKGKMQQGEKRKETALREVAEECGVKDLKILNTFDISYHIGISKDKNILKKTVWYYMYCNDPQNIEPQMEEGITEIRWVDLKKEPMIIKKAHGKIKALMKKLLQIQAVEEDKNNMQNSTLKL